MPIASSAMATNSPAPKDGLVISSAAETPNVTKINPLTEIFDKSVVRFAVLFNFERSFGFLLFHSRRGNLLVCRRARHWGRG